MSRAPACAHGRWCVPLGDRFVVGGLDSLVVGDVLHVDRRGTASMDAWILKNPRTVVEP